MVGRAYESPVSVKTFGTKNASWWSRKNYLMYYDHKKTMLWKKYLHKATSESSWIQIGLYVGEKCKNILMIQANILRSYWRIAITRRQYVKKYFFYSKLKKITENSRSHS